MEVDALTILEVVAGWGCTGVSHEGVVAGACVCGCCMVLLVNDGLSGNSSSSIALPNGGVVDGVVSSGWVYSVIVK